jgi:cyanophycinase-like exopeptidase
VTSPRVLAVMGSGETAPTMTAVHAALLARLPADASAVMLDTPFGFQENADEIAERSVAYFRDRVGHDIEVVRFRDAETAGPLEYERMCARLAQAAYVFAGPGSPSYALRQWRDTRVPSLLTDKVRTGGVVVFASAAAVGLGEVAIPVYEIYKVGEAARWIPGLDVLAATGLRAAVIPHYNNAEGGTHDTRYCYMGERRLRILEQALPEGCAILGVDEHTACIIDVDTGTLTVRGRARVTWRTRGAETSWSDGDVVSLDSLVSAGASTAVAVGVAPLSARSTPATAAGNAVSPFLEEVSARRREALGALERSDVDVAVTATLGLESAIHEWSSDIAGTDEPERAREMLRELLVSLGELARTGAADPRDRVAPFVDAMLSLRDRARLERRFADADSVRDALVAAGVEVRDTPQGSTWAIRGSEQR